MSSTECLTRVSSKSVPQGCQIRLSSKTVLPERCAIVSNKGVLQECHLSVSSQGVPQVGSLENMRNKYCLCSSTYVSAFGFVGFILFSACRNQQEMRHTAVSQLNSRFFHKRHLHFVQFVQLWEAVASRFVFKTWTSSFKQLCFCFEDSLRHVTHVTRLLQTCHLGSSFASSNRKKKGKSSELCAVCNRLRSDCAWSQEHQFYLKRRSS